MVVKYGESPSGKSGGGTGQQSLQRGKHTGIVKKGETLMTTLLEKTVRGKFLESRG